MKKTFLLKFLLIPCITFAQEIKLSSGFGYTIIKSANFKRNALGINRMIGAEFILKEFWYLSAMIGIQSTKFDYDAGNDTSIYVSKYYLSLPITVKNYYPVSKRSSIFMDIGACFSYNFSTKNEIFTNNGYNKTNNNKQGINFGLISNFGFKTVISRKTYFDVNVFNQIDFLSLYKNEIDKMKNNRTMLSFSLYRKLK